MTTEALAEKLLAFSRLAGDIEGQLAAEGHEEAGGAAEPSPATGGLHGFMQV